MSRKNQTAADHGTLLGEHIAFTDTVCDAVIALQDSAFELGRLRGIEQGKAEHEKLLQVCKAFISTYHIHCPDTIYQTDRVAENACDFIKEVCDLVGYVSAESEEFDLFEGAKP